ncbi:hypothetical protein Sste5346_007908 [Sporothrix stenoceras]|uniref:Zn(2)-C6 fungal-type domain-containing protein n=1 Tax=Sporothrix stenoceras TaxID=5173 RepID=A0ABR3YRU8_9PEZI
MESSPKPETKRKHVTTACVLCRESKIKCNGATPACSSCLNKGKECRYEAREDRRKLSLRIAVELLNNRVQQLSEFIQDHGLELPSMPPDDDKTLAGIFHPLQLPRAPFPTATTEKTADSDVSSAGRPKRRTTERTEPIVNVATSASNTTAQKNHDDTASTTAATTSPCIVATTTVSATVSSIPAASTGGLLELANVAGNMDGGPSANIQVPNQMQPPAEVAVPVPVAGNNGAGWEWSMPPDTMQHESMMQPPPFGGDMAMATSTPPMHQQQQPQQHHYQHQHQSQLPMGIPDRPPMDMVEDPGSTKSVNELVDQLSDRVGTLHIRPGGHIRFYGSTSNFNLLESPASDVAMNVHRTIRNDGPEHLDRLGLNKKVPPEVEDHLVELYFTWQDPSFHVVDRTVYEEAKVAWRERKEDTSYYSEALRNAICALGAAFDARHHPAFVTFPRSLADFFADRAKALLEIELDSPCVATIQTCVLLSSHDIGCGRDARGWLFSGMAMRLSFNLALHHDLKPYISKGVVTAAEAEVRRTVFWAACIVDHVWSFYLGQPFRMSLEGVTLEKPSGKARTEAAPTQYCPPNKDINSNSAMTPTFSGMNEHIEDVCRFQVLLFELMSPLSDALCGGDNMSKSMLLDTNYQIFAKLNQWKESLPIELRVDLTNRETAYLPHVLLLHMQYYQSVIYAHRPWMSKSYMPPHMAAQGPDVDHARKMCMEAACAIAQLLRRYEERYTLRRINIQAVAITFSAALLLVFAAVSHYQSMREDEILADLSACFRALDELAPSWDTAKRARDFLIRLQRHWERQARASLTSTSFNDETGSLNGLNNGSMDVSMTSDFSSASTARKRPRKSMRAGNGDDNDPAMWFRAETASSLGGEYWGSSSNSTAVDFDVELDFDLMLATSMEGMPGNWGNVFSVQSSNAMLS